MTLTEREKKLIVKSLKASLYLAKYRARWSQRQKEKHLKEAAELEALIKKVSEE